MNVETAKKKGFLGHTNPYTAVTDSPLSPGNVDIKHRLQLESFPLLSTLTHRGGGGGGRGLVGFMSWAFVIRKFECFTIMIVSQFCIFVHNFVRCPKKYRKYRTVPSCLQASRHGELKN